REVLEETGHNITVHEFLGTLVYESGGRSKIVHYWRMEAGSTQVRTLMSDVRAVDWLPLDAALARLSRSYERTFLENVGPLAVRLRAGGRRETRGRRAVRAVLAKRGRVTPRGVAPQLPTVEPVPDAPMQPELTSEPMADETGAEAPVEAAMSDTPMLAGEV